MALVVLICRATIAPFLANVTAGIDSYKWILFGDDDTVFYTDNALRLLSTLDHNMPYVLSDHIWFPNDLVSKFWMASCTWHISQLPTAWPYLCASKDYDSACVCAGSKQDEDNAWCILHTLLTVHEH